MEEDFSVILFAANLFFFFPLGFLLFVLHVGSNWNLSGGHEKNVFDLVCLCVVSFISPRCRLGTIQMNKSLFYFFHKALLL